MFHFKTKETIIAKSKSTTRGEFTSLNHQQNNGEEINNLVEEIAISRKRFGNAVNQSNVPSDIVDILKQQGRW
jgi:hypothetical protein